MLDERRRREPCVGAAQLRWNLRVPHGQPTHVSLVNDGVVPRHPGRPIVSPCESRVYDTAFGCARGTVTSVERQVVLGMSDAVAEVRIAPHERALQMLCVGLDEEFVRIEPVALFGRVRSMDAIAI